MTRRILSLGLIGTLVLGAPAIAKPPPVSTPKPAKTVDPHEGDRRIIHALNRLTFGPRPGDFTMVASMGLERYIDAQLHPETIPMPPELDHKLKGYEALTLSSGELWLKTAPPETRKGQQPDPEAQRRSREQMHQTFEQTVEARLLEDLESPRQLEAVMVDFWFNHFNLYFDKGPVQLWLGSFEEQAIRPYALGRFRDLLGAVARHPAMLFYLDNFQNAAGGINENYARELMELHTLGVDGGYSQADVTSLAHVLTGWGFRRPGAYQPDGFSYFFNFRRHDFADKTLLGKQIPGAGEGEVELALDMLARHPSTAHHLAYKLAQYFVADDPPEGLVKRLAKRYLDTDGDIREVLTTLFRSGEFWSGQAYRAKFKTPNQYLLSVLRAAGVHEVPRDYVERNLTELGQPLYGCLTPDGYKNTQEAWLSPDAMMRRVSLAVTIGRGRLPMAGAMGPAPVDPGALATTLGHVLSPDLDHAVSAAPEDLRAALILGSPDFMRR
jgi:uncharacterized protein (DUF1800 family)